MLEYSCKSVWIVFFIIVYAKKYFRGASQDRKKMGGVKIKRINAPTKTGSRSATLGF